MTASVTHFDESFELDGINLESTLYDALIEFQQSGLEGSHPANTGGFNGGDMFNGTSYSYYDADLGFAFQATGQLSYYFPPLNGSPGDGPTSHTLWGEIDTITLGVGLNENSGEVIDQWITFTFDTPITGDVSEGRENDVHDVIWGLMNGSVEGADDSIGTGTNGGLIAALENNGLDPSQVELADLVGVGAASSDLDVALAA
ncbi:MULTISPECIES: heme acquisition protein HasA [unclassified Halomonas]|uniref:heme acquisition protein HasA n=1 Tax=unclassified Halomonas TaxID=2609666 RepID=UPI000288C28A|nr:MULTISPECIES: heme acquisition protein HasA [unclassified Halomonas]MCE8037393.1 heme acquisition protein HasAp [Halomonas sp. MCCC 1A11062]